MPASVKPDLVDSALMDTVRLRHENARLRQVNRRLLNALARTRFDLRATEALVSADLKAVRSMR